MKKNLIVSIAVLFMLLLIYSTASTETIKAGHYEYIVLDDNTIKITSCDAVSDQIILPEKINGYTVSALGEYSIKDMFANVIEIPNSIISIEGNPFAYCSHLKNLSVKADHPCLAVINGVLFDKNNKALLCYPTGKTESAYTVPEGIKRIDDYAFCECYKLLSITLPQSLEYIGDGAFRKCSGLTTITIPEKVTTIGSNPFCECKALKEILFPENSNIFSIKDNSLFYTPESRLILHFYQSGSKEFVIPEETKIIDAYAFDNDKYLQKVIIPNNVEYIGKAAFARSGLTEITIPESVVDIGISVFNECKYLKDVNILGKIKTIERYTFYNCRNLVRVSLPDTITTIDSEAFSRCTDLETISLPQSLTVIGDSAFYFCLRLNNIILPEGLQTIGSAAFSECSKLEKIHIPSSVSKIGSKAFYHCDSLIISVENNSYGQQYLRHNPGKRIATNPFAPHYPGRWQYRSHHVYVSGHIVQFPHHH